MVPCVAAGIIWLACFLFAVEDLGIVVAGMMATAATVLGMLALYGVNIGRPRS